MSDDAMEGDSKPPVSTPSHGVVFLDEDLSDEEASPYLYTGEITVPGEYPFKRRGKSLRGGEF